MRIVVGVTGLVLALPLAATAADGLACAPRAHVLAQLAHYYREAPVFAGTTHSGERLEVLASAGGRSFTVLTTNADDQTCLLRIGHGVELLPDSAATAATVARPAS